MTTTSLVDAAIKLRADIASRKSELEIIETRLIDLGAGKHSGTEKTVTVVAAVPGSVGEVRYELASDREADARQLAGTAFGTVFDRIVCYAPCDGFEHLVPKLLTPARARDLVALCEIPGKPISGKRGYVRYA